MWVQCGGECVRKVLPTDENTHTHFPVAAHQIYWQAEEGKPQQQLQVPQVRVIRVSLRFLEFFLFILLQDCNTEGRGLQLPNPASNSQELTKAGNKAVMMVRKKQFGGNKSDMSLWKDIIIVSLQVISCHLTSHPWSQGPSFPPFQPRRYWPLPWSLTPCLPLHSLCQSVHQHDRINRHRKLLNQWFSQ